MNRFAISNAVTALSGAVLAGVNFQAAAQTVLFDFENAVVHSPLPITLTANGLTAQFLATAQGFSIQRADTMGFTPAGFLGNCIYPNSVFGADLVIRFSESLSAFSILYAPQELGCDSSATMRVSAYNVTEISAGKFQFVDSKAMAAQRFYCVRMQ